MENKKTNYQPIDCNLYDELVLLIMRKQKITIQFRNKEEVVTEAETILQDVYTSDGEEFLRLENGDTIRLDMLLTIDGKDFEGYCSTSK